MSYVGIGDLVLDCYIKDGKIIGVSGGKSFANIIFDLQYLNNSTKILGYCGNDNSSDICIRSLEEIGVDISKIIRVNDSTRKLYIYGNNFSITKKVNPLDGIKTWYKYSKIDESVISNSINSEDVIVLDDLNSKNLNIINGLYLKNDIVLDIGYKSYIENMSKDDIINKICNKIKIINLNESAKVALNYKLGINNDKVLKEILKCDLLLITKGKKGANIIYENKLYNYKIEQAIVEKDANGAGDMFFATVINEYYKGNRNFSEVLQEAQNNALKVIQEVGARGYVQKLYPINK